MYDYCYIINAIRYKPLTQRTFVVLHQMSSKVNLPSTAQQESMNRRALFSHYPACSHLVASSQGTNWHIARSPWSWCNWVVCRKERSVDASSINMAMVMSETLIVRLNRCGVEIEIENCQSLCDGHHDSCNAWQLDYTCVATAIFRKPTTPVENSSKNMHFWVFSLFPLPFRRHIPF